MTADPARLLLRALRLSAAAAGASVAVEHEAETPWCSATFVGARHRIRVTGATPAWLDTLPEADLPLRGHLVASCAVERDAFGAVLTVLVLEG